jgi:hypothetical protein
MMQFKMLKKQRSHLNQEVMWMFSWWIFVCAGHVILAAGFAKAWFGGDWFRE